MRAVRGADGRIGVYPHPDPVCAAHFSDGRRRSGGAAAGRKMGNGRHARIHFYGACGAAVFSGGGGFAYVLQLTFGYIIGFACAAFAAGLLRGSGAFTIRRATLAALAGVAANYLIGIPYFMVIWSCYMNMSGLWNAVLVNNILFIPKDIVLCILAAFLAQRVGKALRKW